MWSRPESDEALVRRLLPSANPDPADRAHAWAEWQSSVGEAAVLAFIRLNNNTGETDEDLLQEAMLIAFLEVERCRYQPRTGVPFTAYVKGIARNKIREARRRERGWMPLDEVVELSLDGIQRQLESAIERREQQRGRVLAGETRRNNPTPAPACKNPSCFIMRIDLLLK